jgi:hypothetical protein
MSATEKKDGYRKWLKRFGLLGFLFFLIKGLVWLSLFFFAGNEIFKTCN